MSDNLLNGILIVILCAEYFYIGFRVGRDAN